MKKLLIIGAGGHGRVVADCAEQLKCYKEIAFLDDCHLENKTNHKWDIIGSVDDFVNHLECEFIVAFGNNKLRHNTLERLDAKKAKITSIIHPTASISQYTEIDRGVAVFANAVINIGCKIGLGCIVNTGATIDHDCKLDACVHISPGANLAGGVSVGALSWLGIGSSVIQGVSIPDNVQAGAGSVIIKAEKANALYIGVPAKVAKTL